MKKVVFLILLIPFISFSQGKLKRSKQKLTQKSTSTRFSGKLTVKTTSSTSKSKSTSSNSSSFANNLGLTAFLGEMLFYGTIGVVAGFAEERDLNPYPYFYDNEGEYAAELSDTGRKQSLKIGANYLLNTIGALELNATYKPLPIIGIDVSYVRFSEKNRKNTEVLDVSSIMINYHRVREKNVSLWWGLGFTYVGDEVNKTGFAYNLGIEIYPVKPISFHLSWKESFINRNEIGVLKTQLKYHVKKKAFFVGYHHYQIAGEDIAAPIIGIEIMF